MESTRVGVVVLVTLATACGPRQAAPSEQIKSPPDTARAIVFKTLSGGIKGLTEERRCPVTAHFEGVMTLSGIGGTLRYRWERNAGVNGPLQEAAIPPAARRAAVDLVAKPDEWPLDQPGKQVTVTDRIHVLSPVDALSPPLSLDAMCR